MPGTGGNSIPVDPGCAAPGVGGDGGGIYSTAGLAITDSTLSGNSTGAGGFHVPPCLGQAPSGVGGVRAATSDCSATLTPSQRDGLWDANDVALYLKVSRSWVYHRAEAGQLPHLRVGGLLRFDPEAVRVFAKKK